MLVFVSLWVCYYLIAAHLEGIFWFLLKLKNGCFWLLCPHVKRFKENHEVYFAVLCGVHLKLFFKKKLKKACTLGTIYNSTHMYFSYLCKKKPIKHLEKEMQNFHSKRRIMGVNFHLYTERHSL